MFNNVGYFNIFKFNSLYVTLEIASSYSKEATRSLKGSVISSLKTKLQKDQLHVFMISIYSTNKKYLQFLRNMNSLPSDYLSDALPLKLQRTNPSHH